LLFRSEQHVERWCKVWGRQQGAILSPEQTWKLAEGWYHDRLQADWKPKTPAEIRRLFEEIGLRGEFWKLP